MRKNCFLFFLSAFIFYSCGRGNDLDEIKSYRPDDKYFKASLLNTHFLIETVEPAILDSIFKEMINSNKLPVDASHCADGLYTAESPADAFDYTHRIIVRIKDKKITSVDYDEIKKGKGKQHNPEYNEEMSAAGTTPAVAYPNYEKQLTEKQNLLLVDAVSGATYSAYRFKYAAVIALIKAALKNKTGEI